MLINALVIRANGDIELVKIEPTLREFYKAINVQMIEAVSLGNGASAYVDEEGLFNGSILNVTATRLVEKCWDGEQAWVVGDMIVLGEPDRAGNDTSVPDWVLDHYGFLKTEVSA